MDDLVLPIEAFVRSVGVNRNTAHVVFLGAGASITSGVPSAQRCIWEWKQKIFVSHHPGLEGQFGEVSLVTVQEKIQRWLDQRGGYPVADSPEEYGFYIAQCYPIPDDRRLFFADKIRFARPHSGYKLLCSLAENRLVSSVWTTNFDSLVARAAAEYNLTPVEVGIESKQRVLRPTRAGEILCVSLHGDYRYDELRNTDEETQRIEDTLRQGLIGVLAQQPLIVCGYSGRDQSIMDAFSAGYSQRNTEDETETAQKDRGALYWCGFDEPTPAVRDILRRVRAAGHSAYFVPIEGFDDLFARLALHCLQGDGFEDTRSLALKAFGQGKQTSKAYELPDRPVGSIIKSNAFEVQCPSELFAVELTSWPKKPWKWVREKTAGVRDVVAAPFQKKILCLGHISEIRRLVGGELKGRIERTPIGDLDLRVENGVVVSLLRQALVRSIAISKGLETDGDTKLWEREAGEKKRFENSLFALHESAVVFLRRVGGKLYVVLKPSIEVRDATGKTVAKEVEMRVRLGMLGWQHNNKFNQAIERWRSRLLTKPAVFEFPPDVSSTFHFEVRSIPIFAAIAARSSAERTIDLRVPFANVVKHSGLQLPEPQLLFANRDASAVVKDVHPIRGILNNRPYDYALTRSNLAPNVRLGVVCPDKEAGLLSAYLQQIQKRHFPQRTERDYLLDFPGFQQAFGLPIELPEPGSEGWIGCAEPVSALTPEQGAVKLAQNITQSIDVLKARYAPHVVLVFVPNRFKQWRRFETEVEQFDLHDSVKAYCVQQGIPSQFLEQGTFADTQDCRVWWWLSLALYVKSLRTPWLLEGFDTDSAFVGIGYSYDRKSPKGQQIVLGCSHIYNSRGEGLQYRLAKVDTPIWRGRNPFMSVVDARRVGEVVRQLFYDAKGKLPQRVVIHKRTPFLPSERDGLSQGLEGVPDIEMLEINIDPALRYVSSVARPGGGFDEDNYPVGRGTVVQLSSHEALLWVHGVTTALNPRFRYYQGKRRIPAPLVVRRHMGVSDLGQVATEILGLSKMNWNSFDMYTKLPATVESPAYIARIGSKLSRFATTAYDYRLFI